MRLFILMFATLAACSTEPLPPSIEDMPSTRPQPVQTVSPELRHSERKPVSSLEIEHKIALLQDTRNVRQHSFYVDTRPMRLNVDSRMVSFDVGVAEVNDIQAQRNARLQKANPEKYVPKEYPEIYPPPSFRRFPVEPFSMGSPASRKR
ncbi:MAG: hypothetical protein R3E66_06445 [bacterium]